MAKWQFASFKLRLDTPLHAGKGKSGMVAQVHRFVPGHLFSYALAAVYGGRLGGKAEHYQRALTEVLESVRFAPAFVMVDESLWFPDRDKRDIERYCIRGNNHVTLDLIARKAHDHTLFEVEYLSPCVAGGKFHGQPVQLAGGCWYQSDALAKTVWPDWFASLILGGEGKMGYGRCRLVDWQENAVHFHGIGQIQANGLKLHKGERLPGPALAGVHHVALQPWVGRRHDEKRGFGHRLSPVAWVCLDGICAHEHVFMPHHDETGLGCWSISS